MDSNPLLRLIPLCDPRPLRSGDVRDLAVSRDDLEEEFRPDLTIFRALTRPLAESPKVLLFGSKGCGKSTELARVEELLKDRFLIVGLDVGQNSMVRANLLSAEELLLLVGLAIARAAEEVWGLRLDQELGDLNTALKPMLPETLTGKVNPVALARSLVLFGTTVVDPTGIAAGFVKNLFESTKDVASFEYDVGGLLKPARSNSPALALLQAVNALIARVEEKGGRKPLVLIDDLDKIDDADRSFALLTDHDLLARVAAPMVVVGPSVLLQEAKQVRLQSSYDEIVRLYHIRCRQMARPDLRDDEGFKKLKEIVRRRVARVGAGPLLTEAAEDILLDASAGAVRELIRLLGIAADQAQYKRREIIELEHANFAVKKMRRRFETFLTDDDLKCLRRTRDARRLPNLDPVSLRLLNDNRILAYSNGREWYYPHALLLPLLDSVDGQP